MTIQDLGSLGEFVASFGVIASLIYLAVQVRQNTRQIEQSVNSVEMDAYGNLIGRIADFNLSMVRDRETTRLTIAAAEDPESLDALDRRRYASLMLLLFRHADMAYFQHERGLLSAERMRSAMGPVADYLGASALAREIWELRRWNFVEGLREYIDALIQELPTETAPETNPPT